MFVIPTSSVALITGGSRGIGAAVARLLAQSGFDIIINYRNKTARAEDVAAHVQACGREALVVQADITNQADLDAMAASVTQTFGKIDIVILNASGGLEKDKPTIYAMELNHTAQIRTIETLLPLLSRGGTIVFVTSHWAHFYGQQPSVPAYELVAASKHAGETALRAMIPELASYGVRLLVVSGDVIEGTITPRLLERAQPGKLVLRHNRPHEPTTIETFAEAIVAAATDRSLLSGDTILVGPVE